jgi:hypothetical protein
MAEAKLNAPDWLIRWELALVVVTCAVVLGAIPVALGHIGLSWDALNHHIYLGWVAERPRFDRDYLAASYQAFQYPYLYWPVYKLAVGGASGVTAGLVLGLLHLLAAPACWSMARTCIPGREWFHVAMRATGVGLAFSSGLVLSMFDSTANDLLAAIPLVWAFALALEPLAGTGTNSDAVRKAAWLSALLAGVSVALKFSNGPIAILLPVLWLWPRHDFAARLRLLTQGGLCAALGFAIVFAGWGWQLWTHFGNPFYPLFDAWFEPLRQLSGWKHDPF